MILDVAVASWLDEICLLVLVWRSLVNQGSLRMLSFYGYLCTSILRVTCRFYNVLRLRTAHRDSKFFDYFPSIL